MTVDAAVEPYEVYAIRYATVERKAAENFIGGDAHETAQHMDYFVWLVRNRRHAFVVDTGFNAQAAEKRKRRFLQSPTVGLKMLGVEAATVPHVIITHLHYDHIGNFDLFPQATFYLQDEEMAFATGRYMANPFFRHGYEEDEVVAMVRNVYAGRVRFFDGDVDFAPGISLHLLGGHTRGLQVVRVWTRIGWLVLASDGSHYYANMRDDRPFPTVFNVGAMVDGWQTMRDLVEDERFIIPGHDPAVMDLYEPPAEEMQGIVVRLDAEPRE